MLFLPGKVLTRQELSWISEREIGPLMGVQPLPQAVTNEVFLLTFGDGKKTVFKRLSQSARDAGDRRCELKVHRLASDAGLTPKVLACSAAYRLQEYFPGEVLSCLPLTLETLKLLALQLTSIHHLPAVFARPQNLAITLNQLKKKLHKTIDAQNFSRILKLADDLDKGCPKNLLCHGDLSLNNLLINRRQQIKILDWEYAVLACPAYDLASCISINALDSVQQEVLLREYYVLNKPRLTCSRAALQQQCRKYITVFDYLNALWASCFTTAD